MIQTRRKRIIALEEEEEENASEKRVSHTHENATLARLLTAVSVLCAAPVVASSNSITLTLTRVVVLIAGKLLNLGKKCSADLVIAGTLMANADGVPDGAAVCDSVEDSCVSALVANLTAVPFVGDYVPRHVAELVQASCSVIQGSTGLGAFFQDEMVRVVGFVADVAGLEDGCVKEWESAAAKGPSGFDIGRVCTVVSDDCVKAGVQGLRSLPLIGPHVPSGKSRRLYR